MQRFRRRWDLSLGRHDPEHILPKQELKRKVGVMKKGCRCFISRVMFGFRFLAHILGPARRNQVKEGGHNMGLILVSFFALEGDCCLAVDEILAGQVEARPRCCIIELG